MTRAHVSNTDDPPSERISESLRLLLTHGLSSCRVARIAPDSGRRGGREGAPRRVQLVQGWQDGEPALLNRPAGQAARENAR